MSNLKQVQGDARSFHGTQSLIRSSLGLSVESGNAAIGPVLMGGVQYIVPITVNLDTADTQKFTLPPAPYISAIMCAEGGAGSGGTIAINELDETGASIAVAIIDGG